MSDCVAPLTVGGGVAPLTVGHFGSHEADPAPYVPGLDTDPSALARLSREIEALKAERDGLREALEEVRNCLYGTPGVNGQSAIARGHMIDYEIRAFLNFPNDPNLDLEGRTRKALEHREVSHNLLVKAGAAIRAVLGPR
jgi:hypothetical protein